MSVLTYVLNNIESHQIMTNPQLQSKLIEVEDYIRLNHGVLCADKLKTRRWLRDAHALRVSDPTVGYMMEGMVYRIQGDIPKALEYIGKSYRLNRMLAGNNYASMLSANGDFEQAQEICLQLLNVERADSTIFKQLLSCVSPTLNSAVLEEAISLFLPANPKAKSMVEEARLQLKSFGNVLSNLEVASISEDTYIKFRRLVSKIRNANYMGSSRIELDYEINELGSFVVMEEFLDNASIDKCLQMNEDLINSIIDDDHPFEEYQKIIFSFRPNSMQGNISCVEKVKLL